MTEPKPPRLKSLELQGYKTFATRTTFEFAGAVTAIVGPNGSGKSNLSDALRWVLGEQSFSLLRARKTEDLIFSGSEQRPRASMASAMIVFDNTDGWLPIDYTEVAITRRAYRDGDNEYLLNGQRVRLRDVSELLAQSGLAERTYTIIGQGLVDVALALKAEERRRLFEEAAGIGLHRARREEALKRLETTRRNLERVEDILAELQPRLRSLERQARRAQEYEQVKADLRVVLREWYGYHWHRAQKELTEAREVARARESVLERARQESIDLSDGLAKAGEGIQELRSRLSGWHRQSAQLHTRRETLSRELAVSEERGRALGEQHSALSAELSRSEEQQGLFAERLKIAEGEVAQLQSEMVEAQAQAEAARQVLGERQAERAQVEKAVQVARQALSGLTARQAHGQARLAERRASVKRQKEALQEAAEAITRHERELKTAEGERVGAAQAWQAAQETRRAAEGRLNEARQRLAEVDNERKDALDDRAALSVQAASLQAQKEVLGAAENNLTGYSSGARLLLGGDGVDRLKGVRGALSAFLEIPAEFEVAIAAALGEFTDAVLLDGALEEALDALQKKDARAALLPLGRIRPGGAQLPRPPVEAEDGFLGEAVDLVKAAGNLHPVVEVLLGAVWVVRDRVSAGRVLDALEKTNSGSLDGQIRLVTLQGEIYYATGPVLASAPGAQQGGAATLSRPRQLRELASRMEALQSQLGKADERLHQLEEERKRLREDEVRLSQELKTAQAHEESRRAARNQAELGLEKIRRQIQWRKEEQARLARESERDGEEIAELAAQQAELETEIGQARRQTGELNERLAGLSLEEMQTQLSHWNTRAAVAERALTEADKRQRERQSALEEARRLRAAAQIRLTELQAAAEKLEAEKEVQRREEGQVSEQIGALRVQIDPAEKQLEEAEQQQAQLQPVEAAARQSLSLAEHHHAQARIVLARRQEALDSLRRRIEDDFGLVAFEYVEEISGQSPLPLDGMVEQLPVVHNLGGDIEETIKRQRAQLRRMGPVNPEAQAEYQQVKERFDFMKEQVADLNQAEIHVNEVIAELDELMQREFRKTFEAVAEEFRVIFSRLFGGGTARLVLTDPEDLTGTGIEIEARLPGRRTQGLSLLSGGERSLTATALVFALLKVSPTPFCVLDEVDAMLDEANVGRFRELLRELSQNTQFVVVTHNRNTVQVADVIYGVTMGRDSVSQVLSLKLDEISKVVE